MSKRYSGLEQNLMPLSRRNPATMKRFFYAAIAACMAVLAISCTGHIDDATGDETGMLNGTWVLDTYRFDASGSVDDTGGTVPVVISYKLKETTLTFGEDLIAHAHMGWEFSQSAYSYNTEKKQVQFARMIEVSDDGMIMVLYGTFDVVELTKDKLVLQQPYVDFGLDLGPVVTTKATATYTYHRKTE